MTSVMWFRRDLRLSDNPALMEAAADGEVLPLYVVDPRLWGPAGGPRRHHLVASLRSLDASLRRRGGGLQVLRGDPVRQVVQAARAVGAERVHVAADFGPYGRQRDEEVAQTLETAGIELVRTGSAYAVAPGRVTKADGTPYQVFTPFSRAWNEHGWMQPAAAPTGVSWLTIEAATDIPEPPPLPAAMHLPDAGEAAALARWHGFLDGAVDRYRDDRDKPGVDGTSRMSVHLKWGEIHPRTMLADLRGLRGAGPTTYRTELCWREFYADVLWHHPDSARDYLKPALAAMAYDEPRELFAAWQEGRTGYPVVDAGMRQLRGEGWMHNRVRMIVASFLVKDLHVEWQHGARHFLRWLVDGDLASNNHGWQWVAGSGTDAAPYFRVFNPVSQGRRFDPSGAYVRRWVPELRDDPDPHEPGERNGYPGPCVDHAAERREALDRWERIRR